MFAGFNALSTCEQMILRHFREESEALFYWDYDDYLSKVALRKEQRGELWLSPNLRADWL